MNKRLLMQLHGLQIFLMAKAVTIFCNISIRFSSCSSKIYVPCGLIVMLPKCYGHFGISRKENMFSLLASAIFTTMFSVEVDYPLEYSHVSDIKTCDISLVQNSYCFEGGKEVLFCFVMHISNKIDGVLFLLVY